MLIRLAVLALALSSLACGCGWIEVVALGFGTGVQGSGRLVEEVRPFSGVSGVELAAFGDLSIELGEREELRIQAEDNLFEYIGTEVHGGRLRIDTRDSISLRNRRPVTYHLTLKQLDQIIISSSGDVHAPDLKAERFSVTISSSGDLEMGELEADELKVMISSSGNMHMGDLYADRLEVVITSSGDLGIAGGQVQAQSVTITSSGEYQARDLESAEAEVRLSSNGSATIRVRDHLKASLTSSGDLRYLGHPEVELRTSASGDLVRVGE
jgi:hypothetical protein